ncbi:PREDICTED: uncharacterized protein LOC108381967 [Rhagoletis zephyria]|uniref:uncharacterized protein LOC108381967 n=1 Tax=Rhagoletis zephyria TaxID=28612 RepID=UPI0008119D50|nr:PREDICTED: uncharacterized protein LOC108381967 [Rhagoletis zephyria]
MYTTYIYHLHKHERNSGNTKHTNRFDKNFKSNLFKRFLSFGGGGVAGGSSGNTGNAAAGGGSGNFLFDIIRLFSGSVQTQTGDEAANGANSVGGGGDSDGDSDANRAADGFTEGIPGPVTRLVVLANRGLANLIQDLILRIAATSEKFVNFKAKLITALI